MHTQTQINSAIKQFMIDAGYSKAERNDDWGPQEEIDYKAMRIRLCGVQHAQASVMPTRMDRVHPTIAAHPAWLAMQGHDLVQTESEPEQVEPSEAELRLQQEKLEEELQAAERIRLAEEAEALRLADEQEAARLKAFSDEEHAKRLAEESQVPVEDSTGNDTAEEDEEESDGDGEEESNT